MQELTNQGSQAIQNLAQRYGVSTDAVRTLLHAVSAGGGTMAQFYHPELGGGGQWMQGGMTMVGDMFNHGLQALVSNLCGELSRLLSSSQVFVPVPMPMPSQMSGGGFIAPGNSWWPAELGNPSSSGGQNNSRYAYFPHMNRLAIDNAGRITIYDTLDHQIGGVQQQQGGPMGSLSFSSQRGTFTVDSLPVVGPAPAPQYQQPQYQQPQYQQPAPAPVSDHVSGGQNNHDSIISAIDKLAELHNRGILSDDEFRSKKAELLSRL